MKYRTTGGAIGTDNRVPYAKRESDSKFLKAMNNREYCYIFSGWQMGKSSLFVRIKQRLERNRENICVILNFSTEASSFEQWCQRMTIDLGKELFPDDDALYDLLDEEPSRSTYFDFIDKIVLERIKANIYIFYEEINEAKSFDYPIDEFLSKIKHIYDKRQEDPRYERLTFAFSGVTTPNELIRDKKYKSLNIGIPIRVAGIKPKAKPFLNGLENNTENPRLVLKKIIERVGGQPLLTQQFCSEVQSGDYVQNGEEEKRIEEIANDYIENWKDYRSIHFKNIDRHFQLDQNKGKEPVAIRNQIISNLETYIKIIEDGFVLEEDYSEDCQRLFGCGLIKVEAGKARVFSSLHEEIYNKEWAKRYIDCRCPFSKEIDRWIISKKKKKYLIRGAKLKEFNNWSSNKRLTVEQAEYRFKCNLESIIRRFKPIVLCLLLVTIGVSAMATYISQRQKIDEIKRYSKAFSLATNNLESSPNVNNLANNNLDLLTKILEVKKEIHSLANNKWYFLWTKTLDSLNTQVSIDLSEAIYSLKEFNRFSGHADVVSDVAISPDGNTIVSASADKTIKIWHRDGTLIQTLRGHKAEVEAVAISPDGNTIVSASADKTIKIWHRDGTLIQTLRGHKEGVEVVAFSPDGKTIASGGDDNTIRLWDFNGNPIRTIERLNSVKAIAFSSDGKTIAANGNYGGIDFLDLDGKRIKTLGIFIPYQQRVTAIAFSPDGKTLVSSSGGVVDEDRQIVLWDVNYEQEVITEERDGQQYTKILENNLKRRPIVLEGHDGQVTGVTINPENQTIVSAGKDKTIRIWSIKSGQQIATLEGHRNGVEDVAIAPDGETIISASRDTTVRLWKPDRDFVKTDEVIKVDFAPIFIVSDSTDGTVKRWSKQMLTQFGESIVENIARFDRGAVSPDKKTIVSIETYGNDEIVLLNNTHNHKTIGRHDGAIWGLAFTPDGQKIVSASSDRTLKVWDRNNNNPSKAEKTLKGHKNIVSTLAISDDGTIVSGGADRTVKLWDINGNGKPIKTFKKRHQDAVLAVAISRDAQTIVSQGKGKIIFWNRDGTVKKEIEQEERRNSDFMPFKKIAISPDGKYVVSVSADKASSGADKTIEIWDKEGKFLKAIPGYDGGILDIAFSPDSKSLVLTSPDETAIAWNLEKILELDEREYACKKIEDYLKYNFELEEEERNICDNTRSNLQ